MSGNNLSVSVTADVADLQVKFAKARAETQALSAELNKLAKASNAGLLDAAGVAQMNSVAASMLRARSEASQLSSGLAEARFAMNGFTGAVAEGHVHVATAAREFRSLFEELAAGRSGAADVTLLKIGQHVLGLGPAGLAAVGGIGALTAGLGYLAVKAIEADNAIDAVKIAADFAGNVDISRAAIGQLADELARASNISDSAARAIAGVFAGMPETTLPEMRLLSTEVSAFAQMTGQTAIKAAEEMAKVFSADTSASKFASSLKGLTAEQLNQAAAADRSGDANQVFTEKFSLLQQVTSRATADINEHNTKLTASFGNLLAWIGLADAGMDPHKALLQDLNEATQRQLDLQKQLMAQVSSTPESGQQTLKKGLGVAEKENPIFAQVDAAKSKISEMSAALQVARAQADQVSIDKLNAGLAKAREELSALQLGPVVERMHSDMAQIAANWDGLQSGMLQKQLSVAQQTLAQAQSGTKEYRAVTDEIARISAEMNKALNREFVAAADDTSKSLAEHIAQLKRFGEEVAKFRESTAKQELEMGLAGISAQRSALSLQGGKGGDKSDEAAQQEALIAREIALWHTYYDTKRAAADGDQNRLDGVNSEELAKTSQLTTESVRLQASAGDGITKIWKKVGDQLGNDLGQAFVGIIKGTETTREAFEKMGLAIVDSVATMAAQMAANFLVQQIEQRVISKVTATSQIGANAGVAATAAMASVAAIPFYGWAMAPGVGASTFADAMAYQGSLASAAQGFDIPAGINPVTQLHGREMVLPAPIADTVRNAVSAGGDDSGPDVHLHVHAVDGDSVARLFRNHGRTISEGMKTLYKNGHFSRL